MDGCNKEDEVCIMFSFANSSRYQPSEYNGDSVYPELASYLVVAS